MRPGIITSVMLTAVWCSACSTTPWLNDNVRIEQVSASAPAKDRVVVSVVVSNQNDFTGKVSVTAEVNCGTVTWKEKKKTAELLPSSKSTFTIEFKGIKDRVPTMAKTFEYQARIRDSRGRVIDETEKHTQTKPYGHPD